MTSLRLVVASVTLIYLCGCVAAGTYERNNPFFGETLRLRGDHTFTYNCSSDVIGDEYAAVGTWVRNESKMLVTRIVSATGPATMCLAQEQRWRVTWRGLVSEPKGQLLARK